MSQIIIESSNPNDTPAEIEVKLEKAARTIKLQRENKQFTDSFLKARKTTADRIMTAVFQNMIKEIEQVI